MTKLPPIWNAGETLLVTAPAARFEETELVAPEAYFRGRGFSVQRSEHLLGRKRYLAGTDHERLTDLNQGFADSAISAILTARGGFGSGRLLADVDYEMIARNPKALCGFSDLTALQWAIHSKAGLASYSGLALCPDFREGFHADKETSLWDCVHHRSFSLGGTVIQPGAVSGELLCGCLSMIVTLLGTPYFPEVDGRILVVEDVGEAPYAIDRMLNHLRMAGVLGRLGGLGFGTFMKIKDDLNYLQEIFAEYAEFVCGPVVGNLKYGHINSGCVLPHGGSAQLTTDGGIGDLTVTFG